jgi:protein O-GlcNAc transferase
LGRIERERSVTTSGRLRASYLFIPARLAHLDVATDERNGRVRSRHVSKRATRKPPHGAGADTLVDKGIAHHELGALEDADRHYRDALRKAPEHSRALYLSSVVALSGGDYQRAATLLERLIRAGQPSAIAFTNLGEARRRLGQEEAAIRAFTSAIETDPGLAEPRYNLALLLHDQRDVAAAIELYESALQRKADLPGALVRLVNAWREQGEPERAAEAYARFAPATSDSAELRAAVGNTLADMFQLDAALSHLRKGIELSPLNADAHAHYAAVLAERGDIEDALAGFRRALELDPEHRYARGSIVYYAAFHPDYDARGLYEEAREFGRVHGEPLAIPATRRGHPNPERKLRIGYVSPDFRSHPTALFVLPLFRHHDREHYDVVCYSDAHAPDAVTAEIRASADEWHDVSALSDDAFAARAESDRIDVLVDLAMHGAHNRLLAFARRPAPVQLSYLAYPGTTGVPGIDFRITDPYLDPIGSSDEYYSERSVQLPETYWCYSPLGPTPEVRGLPALRNGHVTFGCLNGVKKLSPAALALFARVLRDVSSSRLLLVAPLGEARTRILRTLAEHDVATERVEFVSYQPREHYLETYGRIDCCLDTIPYNGGTTSIDALFMGVPVVTLMGRTAVGRAGTSIICNVGLPELVAASPDDFAVRAATITSDLDRLAELRRTLRARLSASPLMDAPRFARHFEAVVRSLWREYCRPDPAPT